MQTRSGIPVDDIAPEPPVTLSLWSIAHEIASNAAKASPFMSIVLTARIDRLRAALDATPEPVAAITDDERAAIGRAYDDLANARGILHYNGIKWDQTVTSADPAVLARMARRTR